MLVYFLVTTLSAHAMAYRWAAPDAALATWSPRARRGRLPFAVLPTEAESNAALHSLLTAAGRPAPQRVSELTAGFCNWVYKVENDGEPPVVAKLFSPLAKLRLPPSHRGLGDELAGQRDLGPRLLHRDSEGLITTYVEGQELCEADVHSPSASGRLLTGLADRVASLHAAPLSDELSADGVVLWLFLERMLAHIGEAPETLPDGVTHAMLESECSRMRDAFETFELPVVNGHGDLKPTNVMATSTLLREGGGGGGGPGSSGGAAGGDAAAITFIDFELSGLHYRGYDLFKLFRTALPAPSATNREAFLAQYGRASSSPTALLHAETAAFEPLSWLEAAVFFFFAIREFPEEAHRWEALAAHRWGKYLESRHLVGEGGSAVIALKAARAGSEPVAGGAWARELF